MLGSSRSKSKINLVDYGKPTSIICPLCEYYATSKEDTHCVLQEGACIECYTNFRHARFDDWNAGWRPTKKEARSKLHCSCIIKETKEVEDET
jgi:hypothetical protein